MSYYHQRGLRDCYYDSDVAYLVLRYIANEPTLYHKTRNFPVARYFDGISWLQGGNTGWSRFNPARFRPVYHKYDSSQDVLLDARVGVLYQGARRHDFDYVVFTPLDFADLTSTNPADATKFVVRRVSRNAKAHPSYGLEFIQHYNVHAAFTSGKKKRRHERTLAALRARLLTVGQGADYSRPMRALDVVEIFRAEGLNQVEREIEIERLWNHEKDLFADTLARRVFHETKKGRVSRNYIYNLVMSIFNAGGFTMLQVSFIRSYED